MVTVTVYVHMIVETGKCVCAIGNQRHRQHCHGPIPRTAFVGIRWAVEHMPKPFCWFIPLKASKDSTH